jgi:adenylosuccinate lyase
VEVALAQVQAELGDLPVADAAMSPRHERAAGEWQAEWDALPLLFGAAAGSVGTAGDMARGLRVDPERMAADLARDGGTIMAEAVMMALAPLRVPPPAPGRGRVAALTIVCPPPTLKDRTASGGPDGEV